MRSAATVLSLAVMGIVAVVTAVGAYVAHVDAGVNKGAAQQAKLQRQSEVATLAALNPAVANGGEVVGVHVLPPVPADLHSSG